MKRFFLSFILLGCFFQLEAQERTANDTILMLENKIWRAELPSEKSYTQEMEFRDYGLYDTFTYNGKKVIMEDTYCVCGDTIKTSFCKQYLILGLTDSTLIIRYIPQRLVIGNGPVKYINTINSPAKMLANEQRLDSIWRKEDIWNKGVTDISGKPIKDLSTIEPPRWAVWDYDLTKYYVSQMKYPEELLKKNVAGKKDSISEEALKHCLVQWETQSYFQKDNQQSPVDYIEKRISYNPLLLGSKKEAEGRYGILIDSYGEVTKAHTISSCGISEWDNQVLQIIQTMPHWIPVVNHQGKGHYRDAAWAITFTFRNDAAAKSANRLTAHTTEPHLEVGVPVCYLNERSDTIVPYGKYRYCQTDTITEIGFVYENKPKKSRIVCINDAGKELFYVFKCDNGPDYLKEGLFRMMDEQGRIGFADSSGNVVIHPQFLYATPFANGHAYVTEHGGESNDREHTTWQSDEWKIINRNGNELLEYTVIREDKNVKGLFIRYSHPSGSIRPLIYTYPEDIAFANSFHAEVTLKDLNFDGQDDIAIPLGNYGNQRIQYEDGYLWDKTLKTYVPVKQLKEIANPRIDKEERCLFSFSRESAASYHYERYEYVDAELVKTAELIQTYRQTGGKPLFTEKHYQKGKGMKVVHSSVPIHEISHYWLKIVQK